MPDNSRKRALKAGALAQVLAEEQQAGSVKKDALEHPPTDTTRSAAQAGVTPARYYPTKGRAKVPPQVCRLWRFADRPESEAPHLGDLAASLVEDGQIAAAIVRGVHDPQAPDIRYEIICGQVRWRAALQAGTDLEIDIRDMDDEAAFRLMIRENELRRGLSDYAMALRFHRALDEGLYRDRTRLAEAAGLSAAQLSYYLGFAELPQNVVSRVRDISRISVRLGYTLHRAIEEGFLKQILANLPDIESGGISRDQIPDIWQDQSQGPQVERSKPHSKAAAVDYVGADGRRLFSLRRSGEGGPVLRFSKAVAAVLDETFWAEIQAHVEERLRTARQDFSAEK